MSTTALESVRERGRWALGADRPRDLARVGGVVVAFFVLDRLLRGTASLDLEDGQGTVLAWGALISNWAPTAAIAIGVGVAIWVGRPQVRTGWAALDHGDVWRGLAVPWVVIAAWNGVAYEYNYLLGQWHVVDRLLIVVLAVAAIAHPLFLIPFALQAQAFVAAQFVIPFGASITENINNLVITALVVIAAMFLVVAVTGDSDSSPALLLLGAAVAAHFFVPGRAKIPLDWLTTTDLRQFAFSSYTTGWRGGGDGTWARSIASIMRTLHWPLIVGTVALEVGAGVAVFHRRLLRLWLPAWIAFHFAILAVSGFWLFDWVVVELGLLLVLVRRDLRAWTARNDTVVRGLIAVILVIGFGSTLFRPPRLAWLDAPVSYGYEIEAVGLSGTEYHVALDDLAPGQQDFSFLLARFGSRPAAVAGYGATVGAGYYEELKAVGSFDELRNIEATFEPVPDTLRAQSERVILRWTDHVNDSIDEPWFLISPPSRYWVDRPSPRFEADEPLRSVRVVLVRSLHDGDRQRFDRETVLRVGIGPDGRAVITERAAGVPSD